MPPRVGIEGADAHEAMHARLGLQPAIGVVALDLSVADLMPASSPRGLFEIFDLEALALGPARIHAQQHRGPVLAFGAAGAGMDFEIGVVVGFAREQRFQLLAAPTSFFSALSASRPRRQPPRRSRLRRVRSCRSASSTSRSSLAEAVERPSSEVRSASASGPSAASFQKIGIFGEGVQFGETRRGSIQSKMPPQQPD
jgi:hypothetical protein